MGFWNQFKTFLDPDDGYHEVEEEMYEEGNDSSNVQEYRRTPSNVVSFQQAQQNKKYQKFLLWSLLFIRKQKELRMLY